MTKKDFIEAMAKDADIPKVAAEAAYNSFFANLASSYLNKKFHDLLDGIVSNIKEK